MERVCYAGCAVITNSSALRMQKDVPLVIPEVNHDHVKLLNARRAQKSQAGIRGHESNCSAIGLVIALAPLQPRVWSRHSDGGHHASRGGAGYPGVASLTF